MSVSGLLTVFLAYYISLCIGAIMIAKEENKLNIYTFLVSLVMPILVFVFCFVKLREIILKIIQDVYVKTKYKERIR